MLTDFLLKLQEEKKVTFSYDAELLNDFTIKPINTNQSLESILAILTRRLPFSFNILKESYIIIQTRPVELDVQIKEELSNGAIPGVYVKKNGQYTEKVSGANGEINLKIEWRKNDTLSFEFLGYSNFKIPVKDLLLQTEKTIYMQEGSTLLNELIITGYLGNGIDAHQRNHSLNIQTEDLGILPGDNNKDLLVSLRSLPGINSVTGRAGELRIRGGTPDQTLLLYNNIPIYHKGYYYGTISPFSTDIVSEVKVYRSGYTPRLGGRVGGAIEINTNNDVPAKTSAGIATSTVYASGYLKTPIVKNKLGLSISARSSHPFEYRSPIEKEYERMVLAATQLDARSNVDGSKREPISFDFWDLSGTLTFTPSEKDEVLFNFLTINNENRTFLNEPDRMSNTDINTTLANNGMNLQWNRQWGNWKNSTFITTADYGYVVDQQDFSEGDNERIRANKQDNSLRTIKVGNVLTRKSAVNHNEISVGYEATNLKSTLLIDEFRGEDEGPGAPAGGIPQKGTIHSLFGNYYLPDFNNFMLDLGIRANYYTGNKSFRVEPRLFINYNLNDHLTFKSSAGYYSQVITRNVFFDHSDIQLEKLLWSLVINRQQEIIKSNQFLIGATYQADKWIFDMDFYYKRVENITTNGPIMPGANVPVKLTGLIKSRGMDFLVKRKFKNIDVWANYTLSKVDFNFRALKIEDFPANYDQRHTFNITATYVKNRFRASLGWMLASGVPNYLEDTFFPLLGPTREPLPQPTRVGQLERFNPTHQLDATMAYEFAPKSKKFKITTGISILNVYNRENLLETVNFRFRGNPDGSSTSRGNRYTIGFAPDLMLKIEW